MNEFAYTGPERRWMPSFLKIDDLEIPYVSAQKALQTIDRTVQDNARLSLAFCNANTMLLALRDPGYARTLSQFLVLNDGVGVDLCSRLLNGFGFIENLNGTDFTPAILETSSVPLRIYLLGAKPDVVAEAARRLAARYPRHTVVGARDGYFAAGETEAVIEAINAARPHLLLVGMGNPRQEVFIAAHRSRLDVPVVAGVGAYLDFTAGVVARAPQWVRSARMEWMWRLWLEPRRLARRYTVDIAAFLISLLRRRIMLGRRRRRGDPEAVSRLVASPDVVRLRKDA